MKTPHIRPNFRPEGAGAVARDALVTSPSYPRDYPFVMSHGRGCEVWDVDGNRFLDFAAGHRRLQHGPLPSRGRRGHPGGRGRFLHISSDYWHEGQTRLAERLAALAPMGEPVMSFLCQSGTEAVEGALKLARYVTGRSRVHRLPRRLPRPDDGVARVHLQQVHAAEGLLRRRCPASRTCPTRTRTGRCSRATTRARRCSTTSSRCSSESNVPADRSGGHPGRAAPGRRRLPGAARRLPARAARALRPARHPAHLRRSAVRHRPDRPDVRVRALGRAARHHDAGQGARQRACRSAR